MGTRFEHHLSEDVKISAREEGDDHGALVALRLEDGDTTLVWRARPRDLARALASALALVEAS